MERLTSWNDDCIKINGHVLFNVTWEDVAMIADRLARYEDTGLSPEKVSWMKEVVEAAFENDTSRIERAHNLHVADKEGRVIVLPCKVGNVVYGLHGERTILPMVAKWIETNADGWTVAAQYTPMAPKFYQFSDFGKTVFLTREEAEKALQEMEGKKDD